MRISHTLPVVLLLATSLCGNAAAQDDDAGCQDHPLLSRMQGFYIDSCESADFDVAKFTTGDETSVEAEGKRTMIKYVAKDDARTVSELQVLRNYLNAIRQAGGAVVWSDERAGRGTAQFAAGGRETWFSIRAYDQGEAYDLLFLEKEAMVQEITAAEMLTALQGEGRISLYIEFDFGAATIRPESAPVIEQMALLLRNNPALKVALEGHTDNVGPADVNQKLSEQRANAVMAALVERGIEAGRLSAAGHGMSKPIADNATAEGRARNRRVEMVRQ